MRYIIIENFLDRNECNEIINLVRSRLLSSKTWDVREGKAKVSNRRKSQQTSLEPGETELILNIERRIADTIKIPLENGERMQIVRYTEGGYYRSHCDYIDPKWLPSNQSGLNTMYRGGQRIITVILYLNNLFSAGGETYFPRINLKIEPREGMAFIWYNVDENGSVDPNTYHEARPVEKGEKWVATKCFRERPL